MPDIPNTSTTTPPPDTANAHANACATCVCAYGRRWTCTVRVTMPSARPSMQLSTDAALLTATTAPRLPEAHARSNANTVGTPASAAATDSTCAEVCAGRQR